MFRLRFQSYIPVILIVVALVGGACGAVDTKNKSPKGKTPQKQPTTQVITQGISPTEAQNLLARATKNASHSNRKFETDIALKTNTFNSTEPIAMSFVGTHTADDASDGVLTLNQPGLHFSMRLRIVENQLFVQRQAEWFLVGSASGLQLDLGRELFLHPHLFHIDVASRDMETQKVQITGKVDPKSLLAHLTAESDGAVASALRRARQITFLAEIEDKTLMSAEIDVNVTKGDSTADSMSSDSFHLRIRERYSPSPPLKISVPEVAEPLTGTLFPL